MQVNLNDVKTIVNKAIDSLGKTFKQPPSSFLDMSEDELRNEAKGLPRTNKRKTTLRYLVNATPEKLPKKGRQLECYIFAIKQYQTTGRKVFSPEEFYDVANGKWTKNNTFDFS